MVEMKDESKFQINQVCDSCGLSFEEDSSALDGDKNENDSDFHLCSACTLNYTHKPIFKAIVFGLADGYFMKKMGFKENEVALKKSRDIVTKLPYWQGNEREWIDLNLLLEKSKTTMDELEMNFNIFTQIMQSEEINFIRERPDIFISHSWKGPDEELVEPLVRALRSIGYTVWYDKEQGLKPGELEQYLKDAIIDSKNCIPIICQEYFKGDNTRYELETLFRTKEKKHIIPVWWSDVDKDTIKGQGALGEEILKSTGVSWDYYNGNIEVLMNKLDEFLIASQDLEMYEGAKLYESEAQVMSALEKILGEKIPNLSNDTSNSASFGFKNEDMHVVELMLSYTQGGQARKAINLPESFIKLKHLKKFTAPLIKIPEGIGHMKELTELDLHGGLIEFIPESLADLSKLETLNLLNNPLNDIVEGKGLSFLEAWVAKKEIYPSVSKSEAAALYLLQSQLGFEKQIPQVEKVGYNTFGYVMRDGTIIQLGLGEKGISSLPESIENLQSLQKIDLYNNKLTSLPETIGNLKSLTYLNLDHNKLASLPRMIYSLTSLTTLCLGSNQLLVLPESIGNLKKLKELWLYTNKLSSLPESIGNLKKLVKLSLHGNYLSSLPESIGKLTALKDLILINNQLSTLPETICSLTSLNKLDLDWNHLSSLPKNIGNLIELTILSLRDNQLSSLPKSIGNLKKLVKLSLSGNYLSSLPKSKKKWIEQLKKNGCDVFQGQRMF